MIRKVPKAASRQQRLTPRPPSVVDVARMAGVSPMTVSNVVNGHRGLVLDATRRKVEAAIKHIGYRPQAAGRRLRLARQFSIGMILVDESPSFLADPFITQLVAGLSNHLSERDYALVIQAVSAGKFARSSLIRRSETDALCALLSGVRGTRIRLAKRLAAIDHPLILFQEPLPAAVTDGCSIRQDDFAGARSLADLVLQRGARRLLFIVPALAWPAVEERERGIRAAAASRRLPLAILPCGEGDVAAVGAALDGYAQRHELPDAIMGANDQIGIAAMKWLRRRGLRVPEDVVVTGYNAFEFWSYSEPVLTTVRSPAYDIGARGGAVIFDRLQHGRFPSREEIFPISLQIGGST
jgi:DNA-binding LacI/PurR family transcriptional regulator